MLLSRGVIYLILLTALAISLILCLGCASKKTSIKVIPDSKVVYTLEKVTDIWSLCIYHTEDKKDCFPLDNTDARQLIVIHVGYWWEIMLDLKWCDLLKRTVPDEK